MEMLVHNVQGGTFSDTNNDPSEESFSVSHSGTTDLQIATMIDKQVRILTYVAYHQMKRPPPNLTNLQVVRTTSSPECGDDYPGMYHVYSPKGS